MKHKHLKEAIVNSDKLFFCYLICYNQVGDFMKVFGRNILKEIDKKKIKKVYINRNIGDKSILDYIKEQNLKFDLVDNSVLDRLVTGNHQGIVVEIFDYDYYNIDSINEEDFIVMLDHIEDPHNFGAIIRTCECAGIKTIIIPKDRQALINSTVVKTSVGAIENVRIVMVSNLVNAIKKLKEKGYFIYVADMDGQDYKKTDYNGKKCLVIGNEGDGVSNIVQNNSDFVVSIPMKGKTNSLNASVSAGILIFEMIR